MRKALFVTGFLAVLVLFWLPPSAADPCDELLQIEWEVMDELDWLWGERDFDGLLAYTALLLAEGPRTPLLRDRTFRYRARALKRMGRYRESIEAYDELIRINPRVQRPYAVNMETYLLVDDDEGARQCYHNTQGKVMDRDVRNAMLGMFLLVDTFEPRLDDIAWILSPWSDSFKRFWRWYWLDKKYAGDPLYEGIKATLMGQVE